MSAPKQSGFPQENPHGSVKDGNSKGIASNEFYGDIHTVDPLACDDNRSPNDGDNPSFNDKVDFNGPDVRKSYVPPSASGNGGL